MCKVTDLLPCFPKPPNGMYSFLSAAFSFLPILTLYNREGNPSPVDLISSPGIYLRARKPVTVSGVHEKQPEKIRKQTDYRTFWAEDRSSPSIQTSWIAEPFVFDSHPALQVPSRFLQSPTSHSVQHTSPVKSFFSSSCSVGVTFWPVLTTLP